MFLFLQNRSFAEGADACISLRLKKISPQSSPFNISPQVSRLLMRKISPPYHSGLGKLAPNMLLMGFKVAKLYFH